MKRSPFVFAALVSLGIVSAIALRPAVVQAQGSSLLLLPAVLKINWFGPFAITPNDTARFVYTNLGSDPVRIEWAFTNAETGDLVCGNFGKPVQVGVGMGAIWDYSQTLAIDANGGITETRHCDGQDVLSDELYFDKTLRHELVAWIFISHSSVRGLRNAVDLPTVQLFNSMMMADGNRSSTFGRTLNVIHANPTAPTELPRFMLQQGRQTPGTGPRPRNLRP